MWLRVYKGLISLQKCFTLQLRQTCLRKLEVLCSSSTERRVLAQNPFVLSLSSEYCLRALNFVPTASVLGLSKGLNLGVMLKGCHVHANYQIAPLGEI